MTYRCDDDCQSPRCPARPKCPNCSAPPHAPDNEWNRCSSCIRRPLSTEKNSAPPVGAPILPELEPSEDDEPTVRAIPLPKNMC
ncbi:MAG TPA: hypothetical protein VGK73_13095 [Polyangiaceae bacterium]